MYRKMLALHGPQGWWPVRCEVSGDGYHPGTFDVPRTQAGRFEICVGAILTQNTAWTNVCKALERLEQYALLDPSRICRCCDEELQETIRPAGYYVQKAGYLRHISQWFMQNDMSLCKQATVQDRPALLGVHGVGPETADSILLYAYRVPTFVVDTYTRRIFSAQKVIDPKWSYERIRSLFQKVLPHDVQLFQEYHALLVAHAKACLVDSRSGNQGR